jgi:hypothetical protein
MKVKPLRFTKMHEGMYSAEVWGQLAYYVAVTTDKKWKVESSFHRWYPDEQYNSKKTAMAACLRHNVRMVGDLLTSEEGAEDAQ